jgi:hypothetical protein
MNHLTRFATAVALFLAMATVTHAATASKPSASPAPKAGNSQEAELRLNGGSFALGIGFSWGGGTLMYQGKEYPVSVNGLTLGKVGLSGASAVGKVTNLKDLRDFSGHYNAFGAGVTLAGGVSTVTLKNEHGVKINLRSNNRGVDFTLGASGVGLKLKK